MNAGAKFFGEGFGGLWRLVRDFWVKPVAPEPIAAFRVAIALILVLDVLITFVPNVEGFFSVPGMFDHGDAHSWQVDNATIKDDGTAGKDAALPGLPGSVDQLFKSRWSVIGPKADLTTLYLCCGLLVCFGVMLLTGTLTRLAALGAWVLLMSFHMRNPNITNAGDILLRIALMYLIFMPAGCAWSVDNIFRRKLGLRIHQTVAPWSLRLAQIQIALLYFFSGVEKHAPFGNWLSASIAGKTGADLPYMGDWNNGQAIAWSLRDALITRVDWFIWIPWEVFVPFTILTLAWELSFPLLIFFGVTRRWALAFGYAVHMGIFLTLEVGHFSFTTLAYYLLLVPAVVLMDIAGRRTGEDAMTGKIDQPQAFADPAQLKLARTAQAQARTRFYRVFYDSLCPVCRKSVTWLRRLDWLGVLKFEDLHDRRAAEAALPGVSYADQLKRMYVLRPDGSHFAGFVAVRAMAAVLPLLWPVMPLMWLPGAGLVGKWAYDFIARNRFRYAKCDDEMCSLHLKLLAGKQINDEVIAQVIELADKRRKAQTV